MTICALFSLPSTSVPTLAVATADTLQSILNPPQATRDAAFAAEAGRLGQSHERQQNGGVCWAAAGLCLARSDDDDRARPRVPSFRFKLPACGGGVTTGIHEARDSYAMHPGRGARYDGNADATLSSKRMREISQEHQPATKNGANGSLAQAGAKSNSRSLSVTRASAALTAATTMAVAAVSPAMMAPVVRMAYPPGYLCKLWAPKPSRRAPRLREKRQSASGRVEPGAQVRRAARRGLLRQNAACVENVADNGSKLSKGGEEENNKGDGDVRRGVADVELDKAPAHSDSCCSRTSDDDDARTCRLRHAQSGAPRTGAPRTTVARGRKVQQRASGAAKSDKVKKSGWSTWPCRWSEGCLCVRVSV